MQPAAAPPPDQRRPAPPRPPPACLRTCRFCSLWFLHCTTPTIHSLVGSLNKAPLALMGLFIFNVPWTPQNMASIVLGLVAGLLFTIAKSRGH